jgi:membrane protein DedA with SNARE-associated domain
MMTHLTAQLTDVIQSFGYLAVFVLMTLESALIPIPSEVTMPFAGFMVSRGAMLFPVVVLMGTLGNIVGSFIGYYIGYVLEESVLLSLIRRFGRYLLLSEEDYTRSAHWFEHYGSGVVFVSRLLPGVRTFISLPVGAFKMNLWKFFWYTFFGSLLWSALLTYLGLYLGNRWDTLGPVFSEFHYVIAAIVIALAGYYIYRKTRKPASVTD